MSGIIGTSHSKSKVIGRSQDTAKAWANFDGTVGNPATIRDSYNVSSVSEAAQGRFTINFINAMPNGNYVAVGSHNAWTVYNSWNNGGDFMVYDLVAGSFKIVTGQDGGYVDSEHISILVFGD